MTAYSIPLAALAFACLVCLGCSSSTPPETNVASGAGTPVPVVSEPPPPAELIDAAARLWHLHEKMRPVKPGDWLASHPEPGQTFNEYLQCSPVTPRGKRNTLYIQPVGKFSDAQRRIVTLTAEFMGLYFNILVKVNEDLPLSVIPAEARRTHPSWGDPQILSTYVLHKLLKPRLPDDAAAYIAFTTSDLWPGEGWNFVFGQASLRERVGVWSIYRFGKPEAGDDEFERTLRRVIKTGTHETGHMFSILHCTAYECNMCGSNNLGEAERRPLWLCPECMPKVCWSCAIEPEVRFRRLAEFCKANGLKPEREFYDKCVEVLNTKEQ